MFAFPPLCFLCFFRWCCWTPAEQQPAVQIQLHHRASAGPDQGVQTGRRRLQDLQRCGRQPRLERSWQQRWPARSASGTCVWERAEMWCNIVSLKKRKVRIIHLGLTDLKCEDRACVPAIGEEERSPWIHSWERTGEEQTGSSYQTFPGASQEWKGEWTFVLNSVPCWWLYLHKSLSDYLIQ